MPCFVFEAQLANSLKFSAIGADFFQPENCVFFASIHKIFSQVCGNFFTVSSETS